MSAPTADDAHRELFDRVLARLPAAKSAHERVRLAVQLRQYVETEFQELDSDTFGRLMADLNLKLRDLLASPDAGAKRGALAAIDALIEAEMEENSLIRFVNHLRNVFQDPTAYASPEVLMDAAKVRAAGGRGMSGEGGCEASS